MSKIKEWLKPTKNKVITGVVAALIVVSCSFGIYAVINASSEPTITFKENIVFEYGDKIDKDALWNKVVDTTATTETYPVVRTDVNTSVVTKDNQTNVAVLVIDNAGKEYRYDFKYTVTDTKKPVLENIKDVTLYIGDSFEPTKLFTASDPVDGKLTVKIDGGYDVKTAGTYQLNASATDKNGNVTTQPFKLIVKEVVSEDDEVITSSITKQPNTGNSNGGNDNNTSWTGNGSSNGNNGDDTSYVPPVEEVPSIPEIPTRPGPSAPSGMIYYNDYGTTDACIADARNQALLHMDEWINSYCDDNGYMYYEPN
ncbi:DUF5011 domain-containing protein [Erysipelothrix sp. HDW6C]|uniref:DUF5011 domain-containing protein n=1 Tax=Erysipelothrix sp. HDW6C TaxID=2714930 RepID=UPI0014086E7F|nr:DUF5011 domain-containing protein [Erysipelothrix sp. HDW6C]QIK70716.1 DUF5011 domain-containing protein [Erysipelothrix sp. HDW6C]